MSEYDFKSIEPKWQSHWEKNKTFEIKGKPGPKKLYVLDMFPYPSGSGLHMGHPLGYTGTDIFSRFKRMQGYSVLHPMGYDAFGLPAEQHAINTGEHPGKVTHENCARFTEQMKQLGLSYDWSREVKTCDADYYRWTQWIFLQLYHSWFDEKQHKARPISELPIPDDIKKKGELSIQEYQAEHRLAYAADALVNWCPALGTVLANEEVINGRSERGNHEVIRKPMRQWMLRITKYAERLLGDLVDLDWPDAIKEQQRNWIGRSEGVNIRERIKDLNIEIEVYDSIPQTFIAQTFCVIAPEHPLVKTMVEGTQHEKPVLEFVDWIQKRKLEKRFDIENDMEGIFTGRYIENPFGKGDLPIWIASYVLVDYGTGMVNCSAHDARDFAFAKKYGIPLRIAMVPPDPEEAEKVKNLEYSYLANDGIIQEPVDCKGLNWVESREPIISYMEKHGLGTRKINYRLRDWLFSRQRYWGEPIPIIHWEDGSVTAVPESELPLLLPDVRDYKPSESGESPLAKKGDWLTVVCPKTGKKGRRETNTMPQWAGSCWYYFRFIDPHNSNVGWDPELERAWMPVDLYVGGAEHAVLHLLYSRFWHKVLYDLGHASTKEPFQKLFNQGMLVSFAYKNSRGALLPIDEVDEKPDGSFIHKKTGEVVERISAKMSKSLKNVVTPDEIVADYGADTLRVFLMFMGPLEAMKMMDLQAIAGSHRFLKKSYTLVAGPDNKGHRETISEGEESPEVRKALHRAIKKVTEDLGDIRFNTAISTLMELVNALGSEKISKTTLNVFTQLLSPIAPHLAEELWERLGHNKSIAYEMWPTFDPSLLIDSTVNVVVQVNGKKRAVVDVAVDISENDLKAAVIAEMSATNYKVSEGDKFITVYQSKTKIPKLVNVISK